MNSWAYKVYITKHFKRQVTKLAKHNPRLNKEIYGALFSFDKKLHISIGNYIYKIRLKSENHGKSGGYRMYAYVFETEKLLTPICIYSKKNKENITDSELNYHANKVLNELNTR